MAKHDRYYLQRYSPLDTMAGRKQDLDPIGTANIDCLGPVMIGFPTHKVVPFQKNWRHVALLLNVSYHKKTNVHEYYLKIITSNTCGKKLCIRKKHHTVLGFNNVSSLQIPLIKTKSYDGIKKINSHIRSFSGASPKTPDDWEKHGHFFHESTEDLPVCISALFLFQSCRRR